MTTHLLNRAVKSNTNTRYIQPALKLCDNIISHSIRADSWLDIYNYFKSRRGIKQKTGPELITRYYDRDHVLTVKSTGDSNSMNLHINFRNDYMMLDTESKTDFLPDPSLQPTLEFVGENSFELNTSQFSVSFDYDHIRQSIQYTIRFKGYYVVFELLIEGLKSYADISSELLHLTMPALVNHPNVFSRSFRIYIDNGLDASYLEEHLEACLRLCRSVEQEF